MPLESKFAYHKAVGMTEGKERGAIDLAASHVHPIGVEAIAIHTSLLLNIER